MDIQELTGNRIRLITADENPAVSSEAVRRLLGSGIDVLVTVDDYGFNLSWKTATEPVVRNYRCTFGDYPRPIPWELRHLNEFFLYELAHGRTVGLWCRDRAAEIPVLEAAAAFFRDYRSGPEDFIRQMMALQWQRARDIPAELTHCTACRDGRCLTELVCHVTDLNGAEEILKTGAVLSAVRVRGLSGTVLAAEPRNAAGDPPDYFDYVMLTFGNCVAGDSLVLERSLGYPPGAEERERPFLPGVRFYFRYADLVRHPGFRSDGYHYCKILNELALEPYLHAMVGPAAMRESLVAAAPPSLRERFVFLDVGGSGITEWTHRAYEAARGLAG